MFLEGILGTGYTPQAAVNAYKKPEEESSSLPRSWGNDTVSFSPEAMSAQQQQARETDGREADAKREEEATSQAFAKYMRQARGEEASPAASPEEELENLKKKLKKLTEQKAQIAKEEGSSGQAKMDALDAEINQVMSQISELMSLIAKGKSGETA